MTDTQKINKLWAQFREAINTAYKVSQRHAENVSMDDLAALLGRETANECKRCHRTMLIRDGEEPTEVCDHCAHEMLSEISDVVLELSPEVETTQTSGEKEGEAWLITSPPLPK